MRRTWICPRQLLTSLACTGARPTMPAMTDASSDPAAPVRARFDALRDRLIGEWLEDSPSWGRNFGWHDYDGRVADYSRDAIEARIARLDRARRDLAAIDVAALTPDDALDLALLKSRAALLAFNLSDRAQWRTSPLFYGELFDVSVYVERNYAPKAERARRLLAHEIAALAQVPHIQKNVALPLSKPIAEVAARAYAGMAQSLREDVPELAAAADDPALRDRILTTNEALAREASRLSEWLKTDVAPRGDDSHILGPSLFARLLFAQEGTTTSLAAFKQRGEDDLRANKAAYEALAARVTPRRPPVGEYLANARRMVERARDFVIARGLVTLPTDERIVVRESPPEMRFNPASIEVSGAFETAKTAFFNVTLPDPTWPEDRREGYLQPFGTLQSTVVHETYPGHFVQMRWRDRAPTKLQKMLGSMTFAEGWAHYAEQMVIEEGFGQDDPEMRLGQLSAALMRDCRYLVSIGIHAEGMTLAQAERRFIDDCHQDAASAREQATRGAFDPGYYAYTLGKLEILALRDEARRKLGARFSLRAFHDALLGHGAPPVALVRDRVLRDLGAAP
jgi:hypothetical protein